jgi:D-alanyl-D-alanine carboxypeptidase (penicillin-binding protein 5/6)
MTAYVVLTDKPLTPGAAGPSLTITDAQAAAYPQEAARNESLVRVKAGAVFSERQALQALLLPSANNMARILAAWDAGSVDAFVARMNSAAAAVGMVDTRYTDPAGFDPRTVSTAADQAILARLAMALPVFAEIVAQPSAAVPVAGVVTNTNTILGRDGVVGIKTGSTDEAGGCLVFAARVTVGGNDLTIVGAVFGQPGSDSLEQLAAVFRVTRSLIHAIGTVLAVHTVIHAGDQIASVRGPFGTGTTLHAAEDVAVVGWPGMEVRFAADVPPVPARLPAGTAHGRVSATAGDRPAAATALRSGDRLEPPSTWTRIKRHR